MPERVPSRVLVAGAPSATMTRGRIASIWAKRKREQVPTSSGSGARFSGGRHFTTLAM